METVAFCSSKRASDLKNAITRALFVKYIYVYMYNNKSFKDLTVAATILIPEKQQMQCDDTLTIV